MKTSKRKHRKIKIIQDVRAEYDESTGYVRFLAEQLNGEETLIMEYPTLVKPLFADENLDVDATDYGDYYNQALEEAHCCGLYLASEI